MVDVIHDVQRAYRNLVSAFAFPGTVRALLPGDVKIGFDTNLPTGLVLLSMILLDGEVGAYFHETCEEELSLIQQLTYVQLRDACTADFLFFSGNGAVDAEQGTDVLDLANTGTHIDPHTGATALVYVSGPFERMKMETGSDSQGPQVLRLTGPGIRTEKHIGVDSSLLPWIERRNGLCAEFPLGIELVFYDDSYRVMALPRSVRAELIDGKRSGQWHT